VGAKREVWSRKRRKKSHKQHTPPPTAKCTQLPSHWSDSAIRAGLLHPLPFPYLILSLSLPTQQLQ